MEGEVVVVGLYSIPMRADLWNGRRGGKTWYGFRQVFKCTFTFFPNKKWWKSKKVKYTPGDRGKERQKYHNIQIQFYTFYPNRKKLINVFIIIRNIGGSRSGVTPGGGDRERKEKGREKIYCGNMQERKVGTLQLRGKSILPPPWLESALCAPPPPHPQCHADSLFQKRGVGTHSCFPSEKKASFFRISRT